MSKHFNKEEFLLELKEGLKHISRAPNIKKYVPHEKQAIFHASKKKKKLYIGGNRSGKTTGGVCEGIWRATSTHPYRPELNQLGPTRGRVIAVDFTQGVDKIIIPQYDQWTYPSILRGGAWETAYEKSARTLHFSNGSNIEFMSYDQDLDKFAGTSRHWIHFDEEPPESIYGENRARLIDTNGELWLTMTPVEGMTWVYEDLYEENVNNPDGDVEVIEINSLENPYLSAEALEEFVKGTSDDEVATRIGGGFVRQGGRIYKNFDPTPGALQVLPSSETIPNPKEMFPGRDGEGWLWTISLDHGFNAPTAVYWAAWNEDGFGIIFHEHYKRDWTVDQHAKLINDTNREFGRVPDLWVADPSIINRQGVTGTSIQTEYQKYGISWMPGNNDVKAGIIRVRRYLSPAPLVRTRYDHPLFQREFAVNKGIDPATGQPARQLQFPRVRISTECPELIKEMKKYRWKTYANKKLQFENNVQDIPHKKDDHGCDSIRYKIMARPDLAGSPVAGAGSMASQINDAMGEIVFGRPHSNIADPRELLTQGDGLWKPGNSLPSSDGWSFDEHMGMDW